MKDWFKRNFILRNSEVGFTLKVLKIFRMSASFKHHSFWFKIFNVGLTFLKATESVMENKQRKGLKIGKLFIAAI